MTLTLHGRAYRVVRLGDARAVIVHVRGRLWRLAAPPVARAILAGLTVPLF